MQDRITRWLLCGGLFLCVVPFSAAAQCGDLSLIEFPIEVALTDIQDQLEQAVPVQRYQTQWQRQGRIDIKYRIWRGPLALRAVRDRLHLSTDVGYWVSARKKLLGPLKVSGSCGMREPPRVARLHVSSRLYWGHDWRLHTETRIHRNHFANPCQLTRARIDVTPVIDRHLNRKMNQVLREQVDRLVPKLSDVRNQAESIWNAMQKPLRLDSEAWLLLRPATLHATPFRASADGLTTAIAVTMRPKIVLGSRPEVTASRLPNLNTRYQSTQPGLNFLASLDIPIQSLRKRLGYAAGRRLAQFGIEQRDLQSARLYADQGNLVLQTPTFALRATPVLNKDRQQLILETVPAGSAVTMPPAADNVSYEGQNRLTDLLNDALIWSYEDRMQSIRNSLDAALNQAIHPDMQLRGRIDAVEFEELHVEPDRILAKVRVTGTVRLLLK